MEVHLSKDVILNKVGTRHCSEESVSTHLRVELMLKKVQKLQEVSFVLSTVAEQVGVHDVERGREDADQLFVVCRRVFQQHYEQVNYLYTLDTA